MAAADPQKSLVTITAEERAAFKSNNCSFLALATSDTLLVVFAHASGSTISQARTVCAWNTICTELQHKNPLHTREVLFHCCFSAMLRTLREQRPYARCGAVLHGQNSGTEGGRGEQTQVRQTIPLSVSSVPLVDKAVLIAARRLDPLRCGGVTRCIQSAFAALDLAASHMDLASSTAELTLIAQPLNSPTLNPSHTMVQMDPHPAHHL